MPGKKLKDYLNQNHVKYKTINHPLAYSAKEVSHCSHIPEKQLAKTVIVLAGNKLVMIVVPCTEVVNLMSLRKSLHENDVILASESDFQKAFPDCEIGAMPPFGNIYNMEVYVDRSLAENKEIAFNAGTHTEVIRLSYKDFKNLVHPKEVVVIH